jgi:hypothetical protein
MMKPLDRRDHHRDKASRRHPDATRDDHEPGLVGTNDRPEPMRDPENSPKGTRLTAASRAVD